MATSTLSRYSATSRVAHLAFSLAIALAALVVIPGSAGAAQSDFSLDFVAAAPFTYNHSTGGGAFDDRTIGKNADVVESLEQGDLGCGDIVTYLTQIVVDADASGTQSLTLDYSFDVEGTNGNRAGHVQVVNVDVNDGPVTAGDGPGGTDSGHIDPGLNAVVTSWADQYDNGSGTSSSYPTDPSATEVLLTATVGGLDAGDEIIVRIDVLLECGAASGTGNLQARIEGASSGGSNVPVGAQTVPFKHFGQPENVLPDIDVTKSANPTSVPEPGGSVTFTVTVTNLAGAPVDIISLDDDVHGDLNGQGDCSVPQSLASTGQAGDGYTCSFSATVSGNAGDSETDTVTAVGEDDDGDQATATDSATVTITDVGSSIVVTKDASPTSVAEPGGSVTFSVTVDNTSAVDAVTINSLSDDIHGDLNGQGDCSVPQVIAAGGSYSCSFTATVSGNAGDSETDTVTASGVDDDGDPVSDSDSATVNVLGAGISIEKTGALLLGDDQIANPGDVIEYTFEVTNTGAVALEDVQVTDLTFGDLVVECQWPGDAGELGAGESATCSADYVIDQADVDAGSVENCAQADGTTVPEGNQVSDEDCANVPVPQAPAIDIQKEPDVQSVQLGDDHTFTITVTNTGNVTLTNVTVSDPLAPSCDADLGTLAPGDTATYTCVVEDIVDQIDNIAFASGVAPDDTEVTDQDPATVFPIAPSGIIGDTVWNDEDEDGIEDAGEVGVPNAQVKLTNLDTSAVSTATTDADGKYLFSGLEEGNYKVELVLSSVDGDLTTAGSFTFFLADGEGRFDADFGIVETLPVTGIDAERVGWFGLALLGLGALLVLGTRGRRKEN